MELSLQMRSRWLGAVTGLLVGGIAVVAGPTAASAQQANAEEACTPDVMRLCYDAVPDRGKIVACMRSKRGQISLPCRQAMGQGARVSKKKRRAAR